MQNNLAGGLKAEIERQRAVAVLGAGVAAASGASTVAASWLNLLQSGLELALELEQDGAAWRQYVEPDLNYARSGGPGFITAAQKIEDKLREHGEFRRWIRDSFRDLRIQDPSLIEAIADTGMPILTTNYDTLVEDHLGWRSVTWRNPVEVQAALSERSGAVIHLHGCWTEPDSVIFGAASYERLRQDAAAQALQEAVASLKSLVFIGMGAGVADPNFETLLRWISTTYDTPDQRHYLLCREEDLAQSRPDGVGRILTLVSYGTEHAVLPQFLRQLSPASASLESATVGLSVRDNALELLAEEVREKAILAGHIPGVETKFPDAILVPPVALPIADQQFISLTSGDSDDRPDRSDLSADVADGDWLLIASEEGFGLTSALEWVLWSESNVSADSVPIFLDYRVFATGTARSVKREIWKRLRMAGFEGGPQSEFPHLSVALDNFVYSDKNTCTRLLRELAALSIRSLHVGVRTGGEAAAMAGLRATFDRPLTMRYLSTMQVSDVRSLACTVDDSSADGLADLVMNITTRERILRTPFNAALMLAVALQSESYASSASSTSLVEAYIESLLGRGNPADDPRMHMDYRDRFEVLASFAELLVRDRRGSVSTTEFMGMLDEFFESVGWSQSSVKLLEAFERSRIVRHSGNQVAFSQNAFLFYFAAQRARADAEFRAIMLGDPLYYDKVVRAYSAVVRDDADPLRIVRDLAKSYPIPSEVATDGVFTPTSQDEEKIELDDLMKHLEWSEPPEEIVAEDGPERFEPQSRDEEPFPLDRAAEGEPDLARLSRTVFLCSTVLRDLDLVRDVNLKTEALSSVLSLWGQLAEDLSLDEELREMTRGLAKDVANDMGLSETKAEEFTALFVRNFPMFVVMSGVMSSLTSVKLERLLSDCLSDAELVADPRPSISGAIAVFALQQRGWTAPFASVAAQHSTPSVASTVLEVLARMAYDFHTLSSEDESKLHDLIVDRLVGRVATSSAAGRSQVRSQISERLRRGRMLHERQRLGQGESVLTGLPSSRAPELETGDE